VSENAVSQLIITYVSIGANYYKHIHMHTCTYAYNTVFIVISSNIFQNSEVMNFWTMYR